MGVNGIYGLSGSGLDIESLVKMGMSAKNKQYDKMESQEIANTWLKEAYNDVYMDMTTYKYGTLSTYKMQSNMNAMQATSSNTGVVTATANGAAAAMNHTVTVESVASNAYLLTTQDSSGKNLGVNRNNTEAKTSNKLTDVIFAKDSLKWESDDADGTGNYTLNGNAVKGSDIAISLKLKDTAGDDAKEYTLTYTYDELYKDEKTLNDFASAIARTGANIQGGYDTANDTFSLYNKTSGEENIIGINAGNANTIVLLDNLNLGEYNAATNELGGRITFDESVKKTTVESGGITNSALSTSFRDVLGLTATVDGNTITIKDSSNNTLKTLTKNGDTYDGLNDVAFSMKVSNGTNDATISFTYAELFDFDDAASGRKNLCGGSGLNELAAKINATGLGITATYDAAKDSFSLVNNSGKADLTAVGGEGTVAKSLEKALGLESNFAYKVNNNINGNLVDIFGLKATFQKTGADEYNNDLYTLRVKNGATLVASQTGRNEEFTSDGGTSGSNGRTAKKAEEVFSFNISNGTTTKTISISYDDLVDYTALDYNGGDIVAVTTPSGGDPVLANNKNGEIDLRKRSTTLSVLVAKINDAGLGITATYDAGKFSLLNSSGKTIEITSPDGAKVTVADKLNLQDGDATNMAYNVSKSITRVNAHSTEDNLADGLGLRAVKIDDNTLSITKADGTTDTVNKGDTAFTLKVGDNDNETNVSFTYAELFDTSDSGALKSTADLSTLASKINTAASAANINVTAAYDATTGKFSLTNDKGYVKLSSSDTLGSTLVSGLGLTESAETAEAKKTSWAGTNASVTIDGKTYDNTTNKLTVAGVTYTFLDNTQPGQKATVSVSQDTDKIVDYVKSFVDDYNKLLDSLNEKLSEKKYSDYKPLSKRQEDEMTEKQIEKWNEKAKSGLLYHNSDIQALVSAMREAIYSKVDAVDSEYNTLSSIGITSTNTKGHLTLDTDKLKKALAADPDCVYQLFASDQDSSYIAGSTNKNKITEAQKRVDYANTGIANRLDSVMTTHMKKISDIAGTSKDTDDQSYLGKLITQMQSKMESFKTLMTSYENKLYKRYDAMEVALSRISAQLSYITNSFS